MRPILREVALWSSLAGVLAMLGFLFLGSGLLQGTVDKPKLLVTAWGQQQMIGMSCRRRDTVIKHLFGHFFAGGKSAWLCWLHRFMPAQENRSDVFMLLSAGCCKFSTAGTEGMSCNTAAWSGLSVPGVWLVAPGADFVLRALPLSLASLSGDTFHGRVSSHLSNISTLVIFFSLGVCHAVHHCLINYFTWVLSLAPAVFHMPSAGDTSPCCRAVLHSAFSTLGTGQVRGTVSNRTQLFCLLRSPPMLCYGLRPLRTCTSFTLSHQFQLNSSTERAGLAASQDTHLLCHFKSQPWLLSCLYSTACKEHKHQESKLPLLPIQSMFCKWVFSAVSYQQERALGNSSTAMW